MKNALTTGRSNVLNVAIKSTPINELIARYRRSADRIAATLPPSREWMLQQARNTLEVKRTELNAVVLRIYQQQQYLNSCKAIFGSDNPDSTAVATLELAMYTGRKLSLELIVAKLQTSIEDEQVECLIDSLMGKAA